MPTVLRERGFAVRIYLNDHFPAHVHVFKGNGQAKINLGNQDEPLSLVQIWKMSDSDAVKALELVKVYQTKLLQRWQQIHG